MKLRALGIQRERSGDSMKAWAKTEKLGTGKNTPRRWVTGIINELSVLLWGIDEDKLK